MSSRLSLKKRIGFSILTTVAFLVAVETVLRIVPTSGEPYQPIWVGIDFEGAFPFQRDDDLFWVMTPGAGFTSSDAALNSHGFRGPDYVMRKPEGTKRVLLLGDSCTFGAGVGDDDTFAELLRRWLGTSRKTTWEVINAGVPGYSTLQILGYFKRSGKALRPDIVVVYAGAWNDFVPAVGLNDRELVERSSRWGFLETLRFLTRLRSWTGFGADEAARKSREYAERYMNEQELPDGRRVPVEDFVANLGEIAATAERVGARVILIVPPAPRATRDRFPASNLYADLVREVASREDVPLLDVREILVSLEETRPLFVDWIHPNPIAHQEIAEALATKLSELGIEENLTSHLTSF